jgi:hypothetical protein
VSGPSNLTGCTRLDDSRWEKGAIEIPTPAKVVAQIWCEAYYARRKLVSAKILQKRRVGENGCYVDERSMVHDLSALVTSRSGPVRCREVTHEFDYASGRADLVGVGHQEALHAFETKLHKWRQALDQARRNGCFAHYCYVALPEHAANMALKARDEFRRHGVGLVLLSRKAAKLAIRPRRNAPLLPWLTKLALSEIILDGRTAK